MAAPSMIFSISNYDTQGKENLIIQAKDINSGLFNEYISFSFSIGPNYGVTVHLFVCT